MYGRDFTGLILTQGDATMPRYLLEVSYTLDGARGVVAKGGSARKAAAQAAAVSQIGRAHV